MRLRKLCPALQHRSPCCDPVRGVEEVSGRAPPSNGPLACPRSPAVRRYRHDRHPPGAASTGRLRLLVQALKVLVVAAQRVRRDLARVSEVPGRYQLVHRRTESGPSALPRRLQSAARAGKMLESAAACAAGELSSRASGGQARQRMAKSAAADLTKEPASCSRGHEIASPPLRGLQRRLAEAVWEGEVEQRRRRSSPFRLYRVRSRRARASGYRCRTRARRGPLVDFWHSPPL